MNKIKSKQKIVKEKIEYLDCLNDLIERLEEQHKIFVEYINKNKTLEIFTIKTCMDFFKYNTKNLYKEKKLLDKFQKENLDDIRRNILNKCIEKNLYAKTLNQKLLQLSKVLNKTAITKKPLKKADIKANLKLLFPSDFLSQLNVKDLKFLYMLFEMEHAK